MSVPDDLIRVSIDGPVATISINRVERRNAVDDETARRLRAAFDAFEHDPALSVAILSGEGEHFCGGYDLKALAETGMDYAPEGHGPMGSSRMMSTKPVLAAIEGYAVAGGLELALWCDMRVVSESAVFGVFCRRWGVPLIDGGTVRLPRVIGQGRAMDMILTGRPVGAQEALAFGLANRVVAKGRALAEAQALAHDIARYPQTCLRADRTSAYHQWDVSLAEALKFEGREGERPLLAEARNGAARFSNGMGRSGDFSEI
jgi:enoyl-CoA hydratase